MYWRSASNETRSSGAAATPSRSPGASARGLFIRRNYVDTVMNCEGTEAAVPDQIHLDQAGFGRQAQIVEAGLAGMEFAQRGQPHGTVRSVGAKARRSDAGRERRLALECMSGKQNASNYHGREGQDDDSAVGDDGHPHGQGGGDANKRWDFKWGGRTKAAPRPWRCYTLARGRRGPSGFCMLASAPKEEDLRAAATEQRHTSTLSCRGHAAVQGGACRE